MSDYDQRLARLESQSFRMRQRNSQRAALRAQQQEPGEAQAVGGSALPIAL